MNDFVGAIIVGIVFFAIYRVFELYVRRNERMAIIEKLGGQMKLSDANVDLSLPLFQQSNGSWALRISLLLIGVGIGLLVGFFIEFMATNAIMNNDYNWRVQMIYFASVAIFGGLGLLVAYFIERKQSKKTN